MSWPDALQFLFWAAVVVVGGTLLVRVYWRVASELVRHRDGAPPLRSQQAAIWKDPGDVSRRDLAAGPGDPPSPPFTFIEEHDSGSHPCVSVRDASGREWRVKWGAEVRTETFGTRLAWALGYFAEQTHFIADGTILGVRDLRRAGASIGGDGAFREARFELSEGGVDRHFDSHSWAWDDNPFVGTRELNGLKILMMLLSNWDNKDVRDAARGSNTAIFEYPIRRQVREARYLIIEWGAALGAGGSNIVQRGRWDPDAYAAQNDLLIAGVDGETVRWGYQGQRTADLTEGIERADVRWFCRYAGALTEAQTREGLRASGATREESERFAAAIRDRIDRLRSV